MNAAPQDIYRRRSSIGDTPIAPAQPIAWMRVWRMQSTIAEVGKGSCLGGSGLGRLATVPPELPVPYVEQLAARFPTAAVANRIGVDDAATGTNGAVVELKVLYKVAQVQGFYGRGQHAGCDGEARDSRLCQAEQA